MGLCPPPPLTPLHWPTLLRKLLALSPDGGTRHGAVKRLKQWLRLAQTYGTFAHFDAVKRIESAADLLAAVEAG